MRREISCLTLLLVMVCARVGSSNSPGPRVPVALPIASVQIHTTDGRGTGSPVSPSTIITAWHVVLGFTEAKWIDSSGHSGIAKVRCHDEERDIAVLFVISGGPLRTWFTAAKSQPRVGDLVWWGSFMYDDETPTWVTGPYLGRNKFGRLGADGQVNRGASGGPVVTEAGDLVGVIQGATLPSTVPGDPAAGYFRPYASINDFHGACGIK